MNYPVTTPFGQVPDYPLNNGFHNGIDYGYPMGTPVVVNGVTIGLSNNTGASTGPHLHVGKYVGGQVQDPGVDNGFSFSSAVVYDTGSDATNGNYVRLTADGALWNYLHLESILVTKGQVLKNSNSTGGGMQPGMLNDNGTTVIVEACFRREPTKEELDYWRGHPWDVCLTNLQHTSEYEEISGWMGIGQNATNQPKVLAPGTYEVKG